MVSPAFSASASAIESAISAGDTLLSTQLTTQSQRLMSALAVLTKQKALAANQISDSSRASAEVTASGIGAITQGQRVGKARVDFGGEFGQGYSPCKVVATRQIIAARNSDMAQERRARVSKEIIAAPGHYSDPIQGQRAIADQNKPSCTQDQVDSGLCATLGTTPGASFTAATLFEPAMEGEPLYAAKVAFVNNLVGAPDGMVPVTSGSSPAAEAYLLAKARKDALTSPALASIKEVQLDYSGVEGGDTGTDLPLATYFNDEVKRYSGNSPEYLAWSKVMTAQTERGAMIEMLKIKALDLAIQEKQYRQYERMEAQLASLVAIQVQASDIASNAAALAAKQQVMKDVK